MKRIGQKSGLSNKGNRFGEILNNNQKDKEEKKIGEDVNPHLLYRAEKEKKKYRRGNVKSKR